MTYSEEIDLRAKTRIVSCKKHYKTPLNRIKQETDTLKPNPPITRMVQRPHASPSKDHLSIDKLNALDMIVVTEVTSNDPSFISIKTMENEPHLNRPLS